MKKSALSFLAFAALLGASTAAPPFEPNATTQFTTVSWVVASRNESGMDHRPVTLIGHVLERMGAKTYWFTDGTGYVRLVSVQSVLPMKESLVVHGRIDQPFLGLGHVEVDVINWHPGFSP